jgi:galactokinase
MSEASYRRCRHIITENDRVIQAREALTAGDEKRFGQLMFTAHASMRDDFAASCEEIDALVEIARTLPGCLGARITGGGFGGCTVNLVDAAHAEDFALSLKAKYREQYNIDAQTYVCEAVDGALARAPQ